MKPEAQRIAIAEACGWVWSKGSDGVRWLEPESRKPHIWIPDYLNDFNAMSQAVAYIQDKRSEYGQWLIAIVTRGWPDSDVENVQKLVNAITESTAGQWAEAFLRTIGKWIDTHPETK